MEEDTVSRKLLDWLGSLIQQVFPEQTFLPSTCYLGFPTGWSKPRIMCSQVWLGPSDSQVLPLYVLRVCCDCLPLFVLWMPLLRVSTILRSRQDGFLSWALCFQHLYFTDTENISLLKTRNTLSPGSRAQLWYSIVCNIIHLLSWLMLFRTQGNTYPQLVPRVLLGNRWCHLSVLKVCVCL